MVTRSSVMKDDYLSSLSDKMDTLSSKVETLTTMMHQINDFLITTLKNDMSTYLHEGLNTISDNLRREFGTLSKDVSNSIKPNTGDIKKKLQQRKFYYYQAYRNRHIADIYESALGEERPRIPRKFFKNPVPQHDEIETNLRKELCIKDCEHEIRRLRVTAEVKSNYVSKIDKEVEDELSKCYSNSMAQVQIIKWREEVNKEEQHSQEIWKDKSEFFSSEKHLILIDSQSKSNNSRRQRPNQRTYSEVVNANPRNNDRSRNFLPYNKFVSRDRDFDHSRNRFYRPNYRQRRFNNYRPNNRFNRNNYNYNDHNEFSHRNSHTPDVDDDLNNHSDPFLG